MGEFYDAVFVICWRRRERGAWIAWSGVKEDEQGLGGDEDMESRDDDSELGGDEELKLETSPMRWLGAADLVIGDHEEEAVLFPEAGSI